MKDKKLMWLIILIGVISILIITCLVAVGAGAFFVRKAAMESSNPYAEAIFEEQSSVPTSVPQLMRPTEDISQPLNTSLAYQTAQALKYTLVPEADVVDLASRLMGKDWEEQFVKHISKGAIERVLL